MRLTRKLAIVRLGSQVGLWFWPYAPTSGHRLWVLNVSPFRWRLGFSRSPYVRSFCLGPATVARTDVSVI